METVEASENLKKLIAQHRQQIARAVQEEAQMRGLDEEGWQFDQSRGVFFRADEDEGESE